MSCEERSPAPMMAQIAAREVERVFIEQLGCYSFTAEHPEGVDIEVALENDGERLRLVAEIDKKGSAKYFIMSDGRVVGEYAGLYLAVAAALDLRKATDDAHSGASD